MGKSCVFIGNSNKNNKTGGCKRGIESLLCAKTATEAKVFIRRLRRFSQIYFLTAFICVRLRNLPTSTRPILKGLVEIARRFNAGTPSGNA
jgi:hypothetical protein